MNSTARNILKNQNRLFFLLVFVLLVASLAIFYFVIQDTPPKIQQKEPKIELPGDKINPQEMWMSNLEVENTMMKKQIDYIEKTILEIKQSDDKKSKENEDLKKEIIRLKNEIKNNSVKSIVQEVIAPNPSEEQVFQQPTIKSDLKKSIPENKRNNFLATEEPFVQKKKESEKIIQKPTFKEISMGKAKRKVHLVEKSIPAGTSVKALLVSSIDAPCSIYSKNDPQPIKLRILDNGHLPHEVEAKLKGGLIIASAYGDISTERVYMRIERLTKVNSNGEFFETSVTGFVSGEDGKFGVRGYVVDKSEKIVKNAATSGFLGGIGNILQSAVSRHNVNQYSVDIIREGCANGASSAFDMLADYYIRRAEQVMPVIQVTAGRIVDITFTHQADLGDLYTKEKVKEIRNDSRRKQSNEN